MLLLVALTLLHGAVRIGPLSPVCKAGVPCTKPAPRVVLTFTRNGSRIRARTDSAGGYRVRLARGIWHVQASTGIRITPARFVVPAGSTATRNFSIDTGIR